MRPLCCAWMRVTRPRVAAPGCRHCKHRGVYTQLTPADRPTSRHPSSLPLDLTPTRLRILFFGSDAFSLPTLQLLSARPPSSSSPPPRVAVVCPPAQAGVSRRAREPLPVLAHAQQQHLSVFPVPDTVPFRMDGWEVRSLTSPHPPRRSAEEWTLTAFSSSSVVLGMRRCPPVRSRERSMWVWWRRSATSSRAASSRPSRWA